MVGLLKKLLIQLLARRGYVIVDAENLQGNQQAAGASAPNAGTAQVVSAIRREMARTNRDVAETKSGVSTLLGNSGEALSHIVAVHQKVVTAGDKISDILAHIVAASGSGDISGQVTAPLRTGGYLPGASPQAPSIPEALDRLAMACMDGADLHDDRRALAHHYTEMASLVSRFWLREYQPPSDPDRNDDFSFDYAKPLSAPILADRIDAPLLSLPWRQLWSDPDCAVLLVLGQANAANYGELRYTPQREVYCLDVSRMQCAAAADPLGGAAGAGGSIWSRLGDRLIDKGLRQRVLLVPLCAKDLLITDWIPEGAMHRAMALALSRLHKELGTLFLRYSAVLWQQGETDSPNTQMSARAYQLHFQDMIAALRSNGVFAPVFPAIATGGHDSDKANGDSQAGMREAQCALPNSRAGIFAGPDIDSVGTELRFDGCHFSGKGLERGADLWLEILAERWPLLQRLER